ncbi:MAG: DNA replication/repair protein RecF [Hyphomicrobiaceae bacterium]
MTVADEAVAESALYIETLTLTSFRNHAHLRLAPGPRPVVLYGPNGAGKTNILEAVSLLAPGQGLRRAAYADVARQGGTGEWAVAARVVTPDRTLDIGTGQQPSAGGGTAERSGRIVRIDGETQAGSGVLADHVEMLWLTPTSDGLFTGPAGDRRRFLDRLILTLDAGYRLVANHFERAMRSRNRLLEDGVRDPARFVGLERIMAEAGVAIAAARSGTVAALAATIAERRAREPESLFPWADITIEGEIERDLAAMPAIDVEDVYLARLAQGRERDRAAGRTLNGPHLADLAVAHGPKQMPARLCSTGEQKALLVGLVLAHAELIARRRGGIAPILLLDEIAAHLDAARRAALFAEILHLGAQAWMTGTDREPFSALEGTAHFVAVADGAATVS